MKKRVILANIASILFLTGCSTAKFQPSEGTSDLIIKSTPISRTISTQTNFTESLMCMDDLFSRYHISGNVIGLENLFDKTGEVKADRKDLLISTISKMSAQSKAFIVSAFDTDSLNTLTQHKINQHSNISSPDFFIKGAYFIEKSVSNEKTDIGGNGNIKRLFGGVGKSEDQTGSFISMELNMGDMASLTMLPGLTSSNTIAVIRRGKAMSFDAGLQKFGVNFELSSNVNEGTNQAVRSLIELSLIELLGKATKIPYWECLSIKSTNPAINMELKKYYISMNNIEKIRYVQNKLTILGLFNDKIDGKESQQLKQAVIKFKRKHNLIVDSSIISFELYKALMLEKQENLTLDFVMKTNKELYHAGENIELSLSLSKDAFIHCFYEDMEQRIFKIFPNQFNPNSYVKAQNNIVIPGDKMKFHIQAPKTTAIEHLLCFASSNNLDKIFTKQKELFNELTIANLRPISVDKLEDLTTVYNKYSDITPLSKTLDIHIQ